MLDMAIYICIFQGKKKMKMWLHQHQQTQQCVRWLIVVAEARLSWMRNEQAERQARVKRE